MAQTPSSHSTAESSESFSAADLQVYVPDVDVHQARSIMGSLELMTDMVGPSSLLGMILSQARNEISSLTDSVAHARSVETAPTINERRKAA